MSATPHAQLAESTQVAVVKGAERNILIAMITALVAVIGAMSGLNVAQQELAIDHGASQGDVLWIINAYTVALAALLLPVGAIGDRFGRKTVLLAGLAVFGFATVGAVLATTTAMMIVARVVAGVGAAMIMPVTLSIVTTSFPPEDRAKAIGIWAGFAGGGAMIAMFISAFMVDVLTWRWVFALPLVLVVVSVVMTTLYAPNSKEASGHRFDTVGSVLSALAIGGLVLGIHEGPEKGWSDPLTVVALIVGIVSVLCFVLWERHQAEPLLDISAFRDRGLASGTVTLLIVFGVLFGVFLVLYPFFQAVLGWSALLSAAAMLPLTVVMMPMSAIAPKIASRIGRRNTMVTGVAIFAGGLATMALWASVEGGYMSVLPGLILIGFGMGLTMTPATEAITETLPPEKQGVASALNDTSRELGGAVGIALLGSVLAAGYKSSIEPMLAGLPPELAEPAGEGIGAAFGVAARAGDQGPMIINAAKHAFVDGWVQSMWLGVGMAAVALVFLLVRGPARTTVARDEMRDAVPVPTEPLQRVGN
ncbi:MAG: MFS transporter [Acidimicrobiales bacterium]|nr:MFS transporter [Acidimicrobiales bacterium]